MIIGVDPGGRTTGIIARDPLGLHYWALVTRDGTLDTYYLPLLLDTIRDLKTRWPDAVVAVEDINDPNPHMGVTAVRGLIDTAQVIGAISAHYPIVRVPPGGHGKGPLAAYPTELVGARERSGAGRMRHARSAWDVAGAALPLISIANDPAHPPH